MTSDGVPALPFTSTSRQGPECDPASDPQAAAAAGKEPWQRRVVAPLLIVLVALFTVTLHVHSYTLVGPVDELQHIDYLYKSPAIVRSGDQIGEDAMREEACRGLDFRPFTLPACSTTTQYSPRQFQENGYNTAAVNTPLYYSVTHLVAVVVMAVSPADDLVTAGRLVGGLWLSAGLLLTYAAGRRWGASRWALAPVLLVVASVPAVVYPSAVISPDAATFAVGGAVLWSVLWWEERPARRWPLLALVTALALAMKLTNVTIVVAAALYIAFQAFRAWRGSARESRNALLRSPVIAVGAMALTALVVAGGWLAVSAALAHGNAADVPMNARFAVSSISRTAVVGALGVWLTPLASQWAAVGNPVLSDLLQRLGNLLLAGGLIGTLLLGARMVRERMWALAIVLVGAFAGPVYVLFSFYLQHVYVPPPARYGYALAPAMAAITAAAVKGRAATAACLVVAAAAVGLSVARFFV